MKNTCAIVLAAGRGTRMGVEKPKILLTVDDKTILQRGFETLDKLDLEKIILVVGYQSELVKTEVKKIGIKTIFANQRRLLGTAHSLKVGLKKVPANIQNILVLFGDDTSFFESSTLKKFIEYHVTNKSNGTFLLSTLNSPNPIGALELNKEGKVIGILRQSQIVAKNLQEYPILAGGFCFNKDWIVKNINKIPKSDLSGEYPLPYIYNVALEQGDFIDTYVLDDKREWVGINTPEELEKANKK